MIEYSAPNNTFTNQREINPQVCDYFAVAKTLHFSENDLPMLELYFYTSKVDMQSRVDDAQMRFVEVPNGTIEDSILELISKAIQLGQLKTIYFEDIDLTQSELIN